MIKKESPRLREIAPAQRKLGRGITQPGTNLPCSLHEGKSFFDSRFLILRSLLHTDLLTSALDAGDGVGVGAALGGVVAARAEAVEEPLGAQDPAARDGP